LQLAVCPFRGRRNHLQRPALFFQDGLSANELDRLLAIMPGTRPEYTPFLSKVTDARPETLTTR
jgi:hypothetical protein